MIYLKMIKNKDKNIEKISFINKIRDSMKVNIFQISLSGIIVGIGILTDTYFRIGHFVFLSTGIYIIIGLLLPLWLGILSAFTIDLLQLLLRGEIGFWFWSIGIEPGIIVLIAWSLKFLYITMYDKNKMIIFSSLLILGVVFGGITMMITESDTFSLERMTIISQGISKIETVDARNIRVAKKITSVIGLLFVISIILYKMILFRREKITNNGMITVVIVIITAMLVDWVYHPFAVMLYKTAPLNHNGLGIPQNISLFRLYVISGIWHSMFHIGISFPMVAGMYFVSKNSSYNNIRDKY